MASRDENDREYTYEEYLETFVPERLRDEPEVDVGRSIVEKARRAYRRALKKIGEVAPHS